MVTRKGTSNKEKFMTNYAVDLGNDRFIPIPVEVEKTIVRDHLMKSYHWTLAIAAFLIGFLLGVIASG
jgi:hypothetical protein